MITENHPCPCGSGRSLAACCGRFLAAPGTAGTAEELMRSRYTAHVLRRWPYLERTWHRSSRPERVDGPPRHWRGLQILRTEGGGRDEEQGTVEYRARFLAGNRLSVLREVSRFVREQGEWFYLDGELIAEPAMDMGRTGRNHPCPCGSGKKFKKCCLPLLS